MFNLVPCNPAAVRKPQGRIELTQEVKCSDSVSHSCWDLRLRSFTEAFLLSLTLTHMEIKSVAASSIFIQQVLTWMTFKMNKRIQCSPKLGTVVLSQL